MVKPPSKSTPYVLSLLRFLLGCLFAQHGLEKLWGFAGGRIDRDFSHLHGLAGLWSLNCWLQKRQQGVTRLSATGSAARA